MPSDPVMLLSYVNTQLRDFYPDLESFCKAQDADMDALLSKLEMIDYRYDKNLNRFVREVIR